MNDKFNFPKTVLYLLLVIVSAIPGYILVRYGLHFTDEPYQILNTMDIHRSPLAPLTSWFGGLLGRATDYNWMAYRYFSVTLNNLAFLIGGVYLYHRTKSIPTAAITCSIAMILSGLSRSYHNLFGWDIFTSFFVVVMIFFVLMFIERPSIPMIAAVSVFSAITALVRVPNIVCFPVILAILIFLASSSKFKDIKNISRQYIYI